MTPQSSAPSCGCGGVRPLEVRHAFRPLGDGLIPRAVDLLLVLLDADEPEGAQEAHEEHGRQEGHRCGRREGSEEPCGCRGHCLRMQHVGSLEGRRRVKGGGHRQHLNSSTSSRLVQWGEGGGGVARRRKQGGGGGGVNRGLAYAGGQEVRGCVGGPDEAPGVRAQEEELQREEDVRKLCVEGEGRGRSGQERLGQVREGKGRRREGREGRDGAGRGGAGRRVKGRRREAFPGADQVQLLDNGRMSGSK